MAIEFLNSVDLNQNQLQAPAIESLATAPGTPVEGQMYFDSTALDKTMYYWNGTSWVAMDGSSTGVTTFTNANGTFVSAGTVNTAAPSVHLVNALVVPVPAGVPKNAPISANVTLFVELLLLVSEINNKSLPCKVVNSG